jgi:hypothetical protein
MTILDFSYRFSEFLCFHGYERHLHLFLKQYENQLKRKKLNACERVGTKNFCWLLAKTKTNNRTARIKCLSTKIEHIGGREHRTRKKPFRFYKWLPQQCLLEFSTEYSGQSFADQTLTFNRMSHFSSTPDNQMHH